MDLKLMCEKAEVTSWGSLDDEGPPSWEATFADGDTQLAITSVEGNHPVPMAGTVYYFTIHSSE